ncbi:LOW QUALITY PROTEIN: partner of Y14 and mago [Cyclopterus lumpus]|uniref:LOW QUALITY PROTEIN: partner of Y14 and mago n=1 Tax=Cyclopterus lumpus TaxID=8103 RepID=UPI001486A65C|nr:LOW QUALITY PROTEIN: partner of Y14 and mago [Cyclopterus lumpus]
MATPYVTDKSDEAFCELGKYIAATQRADGTWRKPRRVKDGYTPQEEVPVYENKFVKFFKSKSDLPPGMNPSDGAPTKQQQEILGSGDNDGAGPLKVCQRNMKRKEKRKHQQHEDGDVDSVSNAVEKVSISQSASLSTKTAVPVSVSSPDDSSAESREKAKKIKNLKKKLRQVEELQQKMDSGEITEPTKDQLEKLLRVKALQDELQQLERDS